MELTSAAIPLIIKDINKPKKEKRHKKRLTRKQEKFCQALVNTGQRRKAYAIVYGEKPSNAVSASVAMKNPYVQARVGELLERRGLPRDFFVKKLGDLCEAKRAVYHNGVKIADEPDNQTQFATMKLGMELHGMVQKVPETSNLNVTNYNITNEGLSGALEKLQALTKKLELSECPDGEIVDEQIKEEKDGDGVL